MDKCCANCMYCVLDRCTFESNGKPRNMYVGLNNTMSGCSDCLTTEDWDNIDKEEE